MCRPNVATAPERRLQDVLCKRRRDLISIIRSLLLSLTSSVCFLVPRRVIKVDWTIRDVAIPVPTLWVGQVRNDAIWRDEAVDIRRTRTLSKCKNALRHAVDRDGKHSCQMDSLFLHIAHFHEDERPSVNSRQGQRPQPNRAYYGILCNAICANFINPSRPIL